MANKKDERADFAWILAESCNQLMMEETCVSIVLAIPVSRKGLSYLHRVRRNWELWKYLVGRGFSLQLMLEIIKMWDSPTTLWRCSRTWATRRYKVVQEDILQMLDVLQMFGCSTCVTNFGILTNSFRPWGGFVPHEWLCNDSVEEMHQGTWEKN